MNILERNNKHNNYYNLDVAFSKKLLYTVWILFQIAIFLYNCNGLLHNDDLSNTVSKLNYSFVISRSSALLININFMLLFIFVNKGIVSFLCNLISINNYYHVAIFSYIIFFSIIHVVSHIVNFYYLTLSENDIRTLLKTHTSITGILLVFSFIVIYIVSFKSLRTSRYELFLILHHVLCAGICICLLVHSLSCFFHTNNGVCLESSFWKFVLGPVVLLVLERIYREYIGNQHTVFINAKKHSHSCTEIELYKPCFEFKSGQWVLLNCPQISRFQWHPFTITSNSIEHGNVQIFLKERGEWTRKLSELLLKNKFYKNNINLKVSIPYGCSYNIISRYRTVVLIAGGIGITSFMSLLKSLPCKLGHGNKDVYLKKVHLHWMCKNAYEFDCFIIELHKIKSNLEAYGNLLELNLYITGPNKVHRRNNIYPPSIDFINKRPDFNNIFEQLQINDNYIKVIVCGSRELSNDIYKIKSKYGNKLCIKNCDYFY